MRKKRTKHRAMLDKAQQKLTEAFEDQVRTGQMKREDVDQIYAMIRNGCPKLKEVGPEPTFGKPWYKGPALPKKASEVKAAIFHRLRGMGLTAHEIWTKKSALRFKSSAQRDQEALMASIKKRANV